MKISNKMKALWGTLMVAASGAASAASAGVGSGSEIGSGTFDDLEATVLAWSSGPLAIALAVISILIGGGMGLAQNKVMPALSGVALAAFFAFGPGIASALIQGGTGALY